jgi:tRNA A-37 threonylcarbamoyl transferase component Bud32
LARASHQKIHDLGVVHRDIDLRNHRLFDGNVMFFDFNTSRVSEKEEDYRNDITQLRQCFERALKIKAESTRWAINFVCR